MQLKFSSVSQVQNFAAKNNKILVINDGTVLDVTSFAVHHPGGSGLILNYSNKQISQQLKTHYPLTYKLADSLAIGYFKEQIKKVISPEKALMGQIWPLTHSQYLAVINSPKWLFVQSPLMFQTPLLQFFSHNKWYHVLIFHMVWTTYYLSLIDWSQISIPYAVIRLVTGMAIFSLVEYILHRFLFHSENYLPNNRLVRYLHFILHGIHHMLPVDPDRLVFPPVLCVIFIKLGQTIYTFIDPKDYDKYKILQVGIIYGYLIYDLTHYALHHISKQSGYFGRLQKYHNRHHFSGQDAGYGVSSKFWDIIFKTQFKGKQM